MTVHPIPSDFEARTNATYEALMWALSRPGLTRELPDAGQAQIIEALIDRECAVWCADPDLSALAVRTGAETVALNQADHVFAGLLADTTILQTLRCGSDLYPEDGATLVLNVDLSAGDRLRFSGPGVDGAGEVLIGGLPDGFWQMREKVMRYPMGFELFLVDDARILGVPRSTIVEVL